MSLHNLQQCMWMPSLPTENNRLLAGKKFSILFKRNTSWTKNDQCYDDDDDFEKY